ncbi:MAG TPA: hypothetical protein VFZ17_13310 [Acidimicrobiia bacterium]|nr:hypothetical protein [Acidimicrobiia bacterium]
MTAPLVSARLALLAACLLAGSVASTVLGSSALVAEAATTEPGGGSATTTTTAPPIPEPPAPARPGGSVGWSPVGRSVLGRPVLYTGGTGGAFVAWMDPTLVRPVVVPGTGDPGGPWGWGGQVAPESRPFLVASFNGGFQWQDFNGGVLAFGRGFRDLVPGVASLIVYGDGSFTVGQWGRDTDPAKPVAAVRQNLQLLVDNGAPTAAAANPAAWGASVAGVATMRSAVGVDANGALLWAGGRLAPADLANAMLASGAVRAMQMDINPDWVNFNQYDVGADGSAVGNGVFGATGPNRYLAPSNRDFVAVLVRGTVQPGATAPAGVAPLTGQVKLK